MSNWSTGCRGSVSIVHSFARGGTPCIHYARVASCVFIVLGWRARVFITRARVFITRAGVLSHVFIVLTVSHKTSTSVFEPSTAKFLSWSSFPVDDAGSSEGPRLVQNISW